MPVRKRLAEIVLRSANAEKLVAFYRDVIGLETFAIFGTATFLKIDDEVPGHPQIMAIFDKTHTFSSPRNMQPERADASSGTLHHFAFILDKADFDYEQQRLKNLGIKIQLAEHPRFGWRSIYMFDPDGNSVELVCYDPLNEDQRKEKKDKKVQK